MCQEFGQEPWSGGEPGGGREEMRMSIPAGAVAKSLTSSDIRVCDQRFTLLELVMDLQ